jgi:alanine racemase
MLNWLKRKYRTLNNVTISKEALLHNFKLYEKILPGVDVCPVIKSNAYGHGLTNVASILDPLKPKFLIVDSLYEAYELKKAKIKSPILILGYTFHENLINRNFPFHFAISDLETASVFSGSKTKLHIKVDTGMNRMGFSIEDLPQALEQFEEMELNIVGLMTHIADADNPSNNDYTEMQLEKFRNVIKVVKSAGFNLEFIHAGQSAGSLKQNLPEITVMRLGLGLYGISPLESSDKKQSLLQDLQPVMQVTSALVGVRKLKKGGKVSYNCKFEAPKDMLIGVVPFGYFEGLSRNLSNKAYLTVGDKKCAILGNICMNYTIIDLSEIDNPNIGDEVVIYSRDKNAPNSFANMARLAETIPYELLVSINENIKRDLEL